MSDYNEGDTVRAVKGAEKLEGVISVRTGIAGFQSGFHRHYPVDLERNGYTLTVIERAKPALPTEPETIWRDSQGYPWYVSGMGNLTPARGMGDFDPRPEDYAPFTRLEPVAETAARFAARLHTVVQPKIDSSWYTKATARKILEQADAIAAEFGVTGELGE